jgi:hypothetical protein
MVTQRGEGAAQAAPDRPPHDWCRRAFGPDTLEARRQRARQLIAWAGDHLGLTGQVAEYLAGRERATLKELLQRFPIVHPAPGQRMALSLRELGWRPVTGRARSGRTGCYWTPPVRPQSPQRALWERIRPLVTGGERGRRRPCMPVDGPDIGPELPIG